MARPPKPGPSGVGYCAPPTASRFKPGVSGNPKGRAKGSRNLRDEFVEVLDERITVSFGNRSERVTKRRAILLALVARALKGDAKAVALIMGLHGKLVEAGPATTPPDELFKSDDFRLLDDYVGAEVERRLKARASPFPEPQAAPEGAATPAVPASSEQES